MRQDPTALRMMLSDTVSTLQSKNIFFGQLLWMVARGRQGATQQRLERPRPAKPVAQRGPAGRCDDH